MYVAGSLVKLQLFCSTLFDPSICYRLRSFLRCSLDSPSMSSAKFGGKLTKVALANWAYGKGSRDHDLARKFTHRRRFWGATRVVGGLLPRFWFCEFSLTWVSTLSYCFGVSFGSGRQQCALNCFLTRTCTRLSGGFGHIKWGGEAGVRTRRHEPKWLRKVQAQQQEHRRQVAGRAVITAIFSRGTSSAGSRHEGTQLLLAEAEVLESWSI